MIAIGIILGVILTLFLKIFKEEIFYWAKKFIFEWIPLFFRKLGEEIVSMTRKLRDLCIGAYNRLMEIGVHI